MRFSAAKTADKLLPRRLTLRIARSAVDFTMSRSRRVGTFFRASRMALPFVPGIIPVELSSLSGRPGTGMRKCPRAGHTV